LKLIGCLLLFSGWFLVAAALVMLSALAQRLTFVAAGIGVEVLGLILSMRAYTALQRISQ
jgi:ABC-type transport system involved in cytochrome bd biosynthesis fused ATPase/permease subunit